MSDIDRIVEVYISRQTTQIETASFDIPLILVNSSEEAEDIVNRVLTYSTAAAVGTDFGTTSAAYIIASKVFGQTLKPSELKIGVRATDETVVEALNAIRAVDDTWYALLAETHTAAEVTLIAQYIETLRKVYFTSSSDSVIPTAATTDIFSTLGAAGYDRTIGIYHPLADTEYPEGAWVGSQIVETPGSNTWMFKSVSGVTTTSLSETQISFLETKNVNFYSSIAGVSFFQNGETLNNSWIDEVIFVDWLYARLQEAIFYKLVNSRKIPLKLAA